MHSLSLCLLNRWVFSLWPNDGDCSFLHDQGVTRATLSWQLNAVRQDWLARRRCAWCVFWWGVFHLSAVCVSLLTPCSKKKSVRVSTSWTFCFTFLSSLILKFKNSPAEEPQLNLLLQSLLKLIGKAAGQHLATVDGKRGKKDGGEAKGEGRTQKTTTAATTSTTTTKLQRIQSTGT